MTPAPTILIIVTSHAQIGPGHPTGLWLEEFAIPYALFHEAGHPVTVASPRGGPAPIDPASLDEESQARFGDAINALQVTTPLSEIDPAAYGAVFFPGGHGTMFDLPHNSKVSGVVEAMAGAGKPVAAVCHGPAGLIGAASPEGMPLIAGLRLTAFTNAEESAVGLTEQMPFLLETRLKELGAEFTGADLWADHAICDGWLITGQNPQSSASTARLLLEALTN